MPGVTVRTATRTGPVNAAVPEAGRYFTAGLLERGPSGVPTRIRSLAQLEAAFGGRVSYGSVYDDLRVFFEEGGSEAYVQRVTGPAATKGTLSLSDASAVATVAIDDIGPGPAGAANTVTVSNGTTAGTYKLTIAGATNATGAGTEVYDNLVTPADAVAATLSSRFVRARDLASATAPPATGVRGGNQPANIAATPLTAGTDDRASVTAAMMVTALDAFTADLGAGAVSLPGYPAASVAAGLKAHAKATNRLALSAPPIATTPAAAVTLAQGLVAPDGEYLGFFYPWVRVPVGATSKLISPEGYVAAVRARAHRDLGPYAAPAGERANARFILDTERRLTTAEANACDDAGCSAIRVIANTVRLYGWRSLSNDLSNYALLNGRDVLNTLAVEAAKRLEPYVFRTIDGKGQLLSEVAGTLKGLVDPMAQRGGLYARTDATGKPIDPGYGIDVGPNVNTDAVLNTNTIAAVLSLRVSPVGALIDLTIVKAGLTATV
jgi:hypothetical protein